MYCMCQKIYCDFSILESINQSTDIMILFLTPVGWLIGNMMGGKLDEHSSKLDNLQSTRLLTWSQDLAFKNQKVMPMWQTLIEKLEQWTVQIYCLMQGGRMEKLMYHRKTTTVSVTTRNIDSAAENNNNNQAISH